jgi:ethanolamine permease
LAEKRAKIGSVTYREAEQGYFEKRSLRRHAGVWSLWALGVAAVISGDFSGWNFGLDVGGFGGLLIATVIIAVMYVGLCYSISEMSPALPHTGGAYSFGRSAMGPWGGFITGLAENMEYVLTPAVVVFFAGAYAQPVFEDLINVSIPQPAWWAIFYVIFVALNIAGIEATMRFSVVICLISLGVLAVFAILAIPQFDAGRLLDIQPDPGNSSFLPFGLGGVFKALPFAIWWYLAIEELPLAAEESMDPKRDVPRGTLLGLLTLIVTSVLVLFLNPGVTGSEAIRQSGEPLLEGFRTIFGEDAARLAAVFGLFALAGLIASFHTIIFAYGRNIFSLSRAGYFPHWMSVTHGQRKTPWVALLLGGAVGYGAAYLVYKVGYDDSGATTDIGDALLTMAVFGAVLSYFMQGLSFILLRRRLPHIRRPYRSPIGEWGAAIAGAIALVSLISLYLVESYRPGVVGTAIWFGLGIIYFAFAGRHKLILSPEEEFAMTSGEHGHPEEEGYGKTHVDEVSGTGKTLPEQTST